MPPELALVRSLAMRLRRTSLRARRCRRSDDGTLQGRDRLRFDRVRAIVVTVTREDGVQVECEHARSQEGVFGDRPVFVQELVAR